MAALVCAALAASGARAEGDPAPANAQVQALYDEGVAAARAGDHRRAAKAFSGALKALEAQGRGVSADAGLIAARIAPSLEALAHPQTDETLAFAVRTLARTSDPAAFLDSALALLRRTAPKDEAASAGIIEAVIARFARGIDRDARDGAIGAMTRITQAAERETLTILVYEKVGALEGDDPMLWTARGSALFMRASAAQREGKLAEARALASEAVVRLRRAEAPRGVALALALEARLDYVEGAYSKGLPIASEAERLLRADPRDKAVWVEALGLKARFLERLERPNEAVSAFEEAEGALTDSESDGPIRDAMRLDRAGFMLRAGRTRDAGLLLQSETERYGGKASAMVAGAYYDQVAGLRLADNDFAGAREAARQSMAIYAKAMPEGTGLRLEPARKLADAMIGGDDPVAAEAAVKSLIALSESVFSPSHPEVARDLAVYAFLLREQDRWSETESVQRRIIDMQTRAYGENAPKVAFAQANLAVTFALQERFEEAQDLFERAARKLVGAPGLESKRVEVLGTLAEVKRMRGDPRAALRTLDDAVKLAQETPGLETTYRIKSLIDGAAASALMELNAADEAWRIIQGVLETPTHSRDDAATANRARLVAALLAERRGENARALALVREAEASARELGQNDRNFLSEWAGLFARFAWRASQSVKAPP